MPQGRRARAMARTRRGRGSWVAIPTYCVSRRVGGRRLQPIRFGCVMRWCLQPACDEWSLRIAIRVRRTVAALKTHLVRPVRCRPVDKEFGIEGDAAFRIGVELDHPSLDAIRIKLRIDRAV